MQIIYIAASALPSPGRANSIQVMNMCQAFVQAGHQVRLLAPDKPERIRHGDPFDYYGVERGFAVEWLPWLPFKGRGYVYAWLAARRARGSHPDLVYTRSIPACYFSLRMGMPVILELHDPIDPRERLIESMFTRAAPAVQLQRIILSSEILRRHLRERYRVADARLRVVRNGGRATPAEGETLNLDRNRFHAGYVGGMRAGKGMQLLARLPSLSPAVDYHVVGGSPAEVQHWRAAAGERANITFYGQVAPSETGKYLRSFDVLLAPFERTRTDLPDGSLQTPWLSPLKIIEYMGAGKPIICSDLPAYREYLSHERTALLCDPEDAGSWVAAVERLRGDAALRAALARAALQEFRGHYTWLQRARRVLENP